MRVLTYIIFFGAIIGILFWVFTPRVVPVAPINTDGHVLDSLGRALPEVPEAEPPEPEEQVEQTAIRSAQDLPPQEQLQNPPQVVKGVYLTGWTAGSPTRMQRIYSLLERTELNAVVVDIKDFSGHLSYYTDIPLAEEVGAEGEIRIPRPNRLIKELHDRGIYVIARQTVMQDPILAEARSGWALQDSQTGDIWRDRKGLGWMDPAAKEVWDYNVAIANDALRRGFDEVNFDYIRFASDGNLSRISYPVWQENESKDRAIARFFKYLNEHVDGTTSADLFGLTTVNPDNLGIGQIIEDAYKYFDYISPMVYPSHYGAGFIGLENPDAHPEQVVGYSMERARARLELLAKQTVNAEAATGTNAQAHASGGSYKLGKLRPWLQDFSLGVEYGPAEVRAQIDITEKVLQAGSSTDYYAGWLLWDPSNRYTEAALGPASQ